MSNVLIQYGSINPTNMLAKRCLTEIIEGCGGVVRSCLLENTSLEDLNWCDILIDIRPDNFFDKNSSAIKASGRMYIVFIDDDLLEKKGRYLGRDYGLKRCIRRADALMGSNPELLESYCKEFDISRMILGDTYVNKENIIPAIAPEKHISIVFAAGNNHEEPFEKYIEPALQQLVIEGNTLFSLTFIGVRPKVSECLKKSIKVKYIEGMPLAEYDKFMKENRYSIGLAPLEDNVFCKRKYFNKFFEYSKVGIMGMYSNCRPYTYVIKSGDNGILVNNSVEEWTRALRKVLYSPELICNIASNAQNTLRTMFNKERVCETVKRQAPEFADIQEITYKRIENCTDSVLCYFCILFGKIWGYYSFLRENGFSEFMKKVQERLNR